MKENNTHGSGEVQNTSTFLRERIKTKPINKRKLFRKTLTTVALAVLFGVVSCATFLLLEPLFSKVLDSNKKGGENFISLTPGEDEILYPEGDDDILPDELLGDPVDSEVIQEIEGLTEEQVQAIVDSFTIELSDYRRLYSKVYNLVVKVKSSLVSVRGVSMDTDLFANPYEDAAAVSGIILQATEEEYLILVDYAALEGKEKLGVTFIVGAEVPAELVKKDPNTGFAVLRVAKSEMDPKTVEAAGAIVLGNSMSYGVLGGFVIAVGNPLGVADSFEYGMVASSSQMIGVADRNYSLFVTNIYGSRNASGFIINLSGQLMGVIRQDYAPEDTKHLIHFIGISNLRKPLETIMNGREIAYLGVRGMDVTADTMAKYGIPKGAYISSIDVDSPAMEAGIRNGDVITKINGTAIGSYTEYTNTLALFEQGTEITLTIRRPGATEYRELEITVTVSALGAE